MIRVTHDKAKLRDDDFVWVIVERHNASSETQATVCGSCTFPVPGQADRLGPKLPVEDAFKQAYLFAKEKGFSAIWIDDPDRLFDVEPWVQKGLIDYLDDHS